jgi:hypothetical protein
MVVKQPLCFKNDHHTQNLINFFGMQMKILHRYLAGSLVRGYLPVLAVFLSVFSLLAFIEELDQVGKGR